MWLVSRIRVFLLGSSRVSRGSSTSSVKVILSKPSCFVIDIVEFLVANFDVVESASKFRESYLSEFISTILAIFCISVSSDLI